MTRGSDIIYGPRVGSLAFRVCLHLASRPDDLLTTRQIAQRFGARQDGVTVMLRGAVQCGWLDCDPGSPGPGNTNEYTAGPEILRLHGRES